MLSSLLLVRTEPHLDDEGWVEAQNGIAAMGDTLSRVHLSFSCCINMLSHAPIQCLVAMFSFHFDDPFLCLFNVLLWVGSTRTHQSPDMYAGSASA